MTPESRAEVWDAGYASGLTGRYGEGHSRTEQAKAARKRLIAHHLTMSERALWDSGQYAAWAEKLRAVDRTQGET